jgi:hypothetical protein
MTFYEQMRQAAGIQARDAERRAVRTEEQRALQEMIDRTLSEIRINASIIARELAARGVKIEQEFIAIEEVTQRGWRAWFGPAYLTVSKPLAAGWAITFSSKAPDTPYQKTRISAVVLSASGNVVAIEAPLYERKGSRAAISQPRIMECWRASVTELQEMFCMGDYEYRLEQYRALQRKLAGFALDRRLDPELFQ